MLQLTINRTPWQAFSEALANREDFRTHGNLHGERGSRYGTGQMPEPHASEYRERREHIDYTVLSYSTPIAWHDVERGWVMPDVRYSVTTSKAQGRIAPYVKSLPKATDEHDACPVHEEPFRLCGCEFERVPAYADGSYRRYDEDGMDIDE